MSRTDTSRGPTPVNGSHESGGGATPSPSSRGGLLGAWPALLAALTFGASTPASKAWLGGVPPLLASGWLYLCSGVGLSIWMLLRRGSHEEPLARRDLPWLAGAILAGGTAAPFAYLQGLSSTPAHAVSLLLNLEVVFTTVLAIAFFREQVKGQQRLGIALVVIGSAACSITSAEGPAGGGSIVGGVWIALACLGWAIDNNLTRRIAAKDAADIARWKGFAGGISSIAIGLLVAGLPAMPAREAWLGGAAIGVVGYGLSLALFIGSMRRLGVARTSALFGTFPFIGVLASALVLHERLSPWTAVAGVVIAAGAALLVIERRT